MLPVYFPLTQGLCLAILDCYRPKNPNRDLVEQIERHGAAVLQLPHLKTGKRYNYVTIFSSANAQPPNPMAGDMPFYPAYSSGLAVLRMDITPDHTGPHLFVIPFSTLFAILRKGKPDIMAQGCSDQDMLDYPTVLPWSAWGPSTRYMGSVMEHFFQDACGSRYIRREELGGRFVVVIYDFASVPSLLEDVRTTGLLPTLPVPIGQPYHHDSPWDSWISTSAPYRRVVTNIVMNLFDSAWLYWDGIILLRDHLRSESRRLTLYKVADYDLT